MTSSELQVVDEGRETVVFWDGCEWTREELDALRPDLFDFVQQHPRLIESPPYSVPRELLLWFVVSAISVVILAVMFQFFRLWNFTDWLTYMLGMFLLYCLFRVVPGFFWPKLKMVAECGEFNVYGRWKKPLWSERLADIDWRIGRGYRCHSRNGCILYGNLRKVILIKQPGQRRWFDQDKHYGCGWTPEMKELWLLLFEVVNRGQCPEFGPPAEHPTTT